MAAKKTQPAIDFNLDKMEIPEEAREYAFSFKGKRFVTVNPVEIPFEDLESAWRIDDDLLSAKALINLLLADKAEDFWKLKPSIWQVLNIQKELDAPLRLIFGSPGESSDS